MEYGWLPTLYAKFGVPYPKLSFAVVFVIGGFIAIGGWWLVGADYQRQETSQKATNDLQKEVARLSGIPDQVTRLSTRIDGIQGVNAETERKQRELAEQRRKNRNVVGDFLARGNAIKDECTSLAAKPELEEKAYQWAKQTSTGLAQIDKSYAGRFQGASGLSYSRSIGNQPLPQINNNVWNWVNQRTDALTRILESMPN